MPIHIICIKYKVKDINKGWSYSGIYKLGETGVENNDTDDELKRKMSSILIKKNILMTESLFLIITMGSPRSVGLNVYNKALSKSGGVVFKLDIAEHLGLAHYVVVGTTFVLESLDVVLYDKDDYLIVK